MSIEIINKSGKIVARLSDSADAKDDVIITKDGKEVPYIDAALEAESKAKNPKKKPE